MRDNQYLDQFEKQGLITKKQALDNAAITSYFIFCIKEDDGYWKIPELLSRVFAVITVNLQTKNKHITFKDFFEEFKNNLEMYTFDSKFSITDTESLIIHFLLENEELYKSCIEKIESKMVNEFEKELPYFGEVKDIEPIRYCGDKFEVVIPYKEEFTELSKKINQLCEATEQAKLYQKEAFEMWKASKKFHTPLSFEILALAILLVCITCLLKPELFHPILSLLK